MATPVNLPPRLFYTTAQLAEFWQCEEGLVRHYVNEGLLRSAIRTISFHRNIRLFAIGECDAEVVSQWRYADSPMGLVEGAFSGFEIPRQNWPKFLYLPAGKHVLRNTSNKIRFGDGVIGRYALNYFCTILELTKGEQVGLAIIDESENSLLKPYRYDLNSFFCDDLIDFREVIITQDERIRFEKATWLKGASPSLLGCAEYSTPILELMQAVVEKFFHPRPSVDPKKDAVVSWIIERMKNDELDPSINLAEAIFTIIKPPDHNPRRRKVLDDN
ncbi:hypothetical protein [Litorivivens sp.]|uniref:hypothetical protein n=1 Tax=Litorivivens sp. TaxID=2020868 RepID=UPI0035648C4D